MISNQITGGVVDVEAVRDMFAVEGEVCAINRGAWRESAFCSSQNVVLLVLLVFFLPEGDWA